MDKKLERNIIRTLTIILILIGVFGCASVKPITNLKTKEITTLDTISKIPTIVSVLGCMFAPGSPNCDKDIKDKPVSAITDAEVD